MPRPEKGPLRPTNRGAPAWRAKISTWTCHPLAGTEGRTDGRTDDSSSAASCGRARGRAGVCTLAIRPPPSGRERARDSPDPVSAAGQAEGAEECGGRPGGGWVGARTGGKVGEPPSLSLWLLLLLNPATLPPHMTE
eukprot:scaffold1928_cov381-Prasinococcus_capsulatus_cf.AAC.12